MTAKAKASPRVAEHLEKLRASGLSTEAFFDALSGIKNDSALPNSHREALYRMVAMESYIWYLEALRGEPVDRIALFLEAKKAAADGEPAIKRKTPAKSPPQT